MLTPVHKYGHMKTYHHLFARVRERWLDCRNRLLADPRVQHAAQRFPLSRPIARRRAGALFDLVAGFTYSQILAACVETGLLALLARGPADAQTIAAQLDLPVAGAERLLRGAAALRLVEPCGADWALGSDGAALLGNPGITAMIAHHRLLYADLADPVALLRRGGGGGAVSDHWHYAESAGQGDAAAVSAYSTLMAASQPMVAGQTLAAYRFDRHRRVLDVGGGEGAFLCALGARFESPGLGLFDLPAVTERARGRLDSAGLGTRATLHGGDFLIDPLPEGYDLITLVRVLHDHDDAVALTLLRRIHAALPPGGTLLIAEPMAQTPGAERSGDAYFGFYLLAMGTGRPRSVAEIRAMLHAVGFDKVRTRRTALPLIACVITATR